MDSIPIQNPAHRQRSAGIDLLRILASFYIVLLHVLGWGGLYGTTAEGSRQQAVSGLLYLWGFCGVNIFGLISGYVGYSETEKPIPWKSLLRLWVEVVFYDVALTLLTIWLYPDNATPADLLPTFFPLLTNSHWYFTTYAALIPFIPLLNSAVGGCRKETLMRFLAVFVVFSLPLSSFQGLFFTGYSLFWLLILYLTGAILKKTDLGASLHPLVCIGGIALMGATSFLFFTYGKPILLFGSVIEPEAAAQFIFPCHYFSAMFHLLLFSRVKFPRTVNKMILALAPGAFAVYIINTQKHVWDGYLQDRFVRWAFSSPLGIAVRALAVSALFVAVSLIADWLRRRLFGLFRRR